MTETWAEKARRLARELASIPGAVPLHVLGTGLWLHDKADEWDSKHPEVECSACNGVGRTGRQCRCPRNDCGHSNAKTCETCNGTGKVRG